MAMQDNIGSASFLVFYLITIWAYVVLITLKYKNVKNREKAWLYIFLAYFLLAFGDSFHLGLRIYIYFGNLEYYSEFTMNLFGIGFLATNITLTFFYIALLHAWINQYGKYYSTPKNVKIYTIIVYAVAIIRLPLIFSPYNHWFDYDAPLEFGFDFRIVTAIPLYIAGLIPVLLLYKDSKMEFTKKKGVDPNWNFANNRASIWYLISFGFFSLTTFLVVYIPMTGMFMIPKTVAYLIALYYHYKYIFKKPEN